MPGHKLKFRVTAVFPALNDEECMFYVSLGLTEVGVFGGPKGCVIVGQELEIEGLRPYLDMDSKCQSMITELYKSGRSDTSEVPDPDGETVWSVPNNFELLDGVSPDKGLFLSEIWRLMRATGVMNVRDRFQFYGAEGGDPYEFLALGYRIAEYEWKFSHEDAANAGYRVRSERQEGQRIAAENRAAESKTKDARLLRLAKHLIKHAPELARNDSALARALGKHSELPDGIGEPGIRKRLGQLRKSGKL